MSDEFLKIARKEIEEDLDSLKGLLQKCHDDNTLYDNVEVMERHIHKIKGLAPMMKQQGVGEIAKISDSLLKHVIKNGIMTDSYIITKYAIESMMDSFNGNSDSEIKFKKFITDSYSHILGI